MRDKEFLRSVKYNKNSYAMYVYTWYLVATVACEVTQNIGFFTAPLYMYKDFSDLTSPTSSQLNLVISAVYDTFKQFLPMHVHIV